MIVVDDINHRQLPGTGQVKGFGKITLGGGAITKGAQGNPHGITGVMADSDGGGNAGGVTGLGGDGNAVG